MSEIEQIRECLGPVTPCAVCKALALLDGAVGLVREGDVVLSAEQVDHFWPYHTRGKCEICDRLHAWRAEARARA